MKCTFDLAWRGPCGKENCEEHVGLKCSSCGEPATKQCAETMGLVCGCLLCNDCEHEISEDGTNGRTFNHCRKDAQTYKPWYARENEEDKYVNKDDAWIMEKAEQEEKLATGILACGGLVQESDRNDG